MNKIKKAAIYAWIALQVLILVYLWGALMYSAFTLTPIESIVNWHWWVFLFALDLWTYKAIKVDSKLYQTGE